VRLSILINMPDRPPATITPFYGSTPRATASRSTRGAASNYPQRATCATWKGTLTLCESGSDDPLVMLFGMRVDRRGSVRSTQGDARWQSMARRQTVNGHWRLRAVERTASTPVVPRANERADKSKRRYQDQCSQPNDSSCLCGR
jgi:Protein of unknown function (DUF3564)